MILICFILFLLAIYGLAIPAESASSLNQQFLELLKFSAPLIATHPMAGFDVTVALRLDASGNLLAKYRLWKNNLCYAGGMGQTPENQCRYLLELWKELVGDSYATFDRFQHLLQGNEMTADLLLKFRNHTNKGKNFCEKDNLLKYSAD